jgi:hypothetical protein
MAHGTTNGIQAGSFSATFGSAVTAGNLLVVIPNTYNGANIVVNPVITDNASGGSNSYVGSNSNSTTQAFPGSSNVMTTNLWFAIAGSGGATVVTGEFNPELGGAFGTITVFEISGAGSTFSLSTPTAIGAAGTGGAAAPGSIPVVGSCMAFSVVNQINVTSGSWTPSAGYTTAVDLPFVGSPLQLGTNVSYLLNTTTTPTVPTATIPGLGVWTAAGFVLTTLAPVVVGPEITKSGTLALFLVASQSGLSNNNWPLAQITAVNANPTFKVNGSTASFGPPVWHDSAHDISQVAYRVQCGHVTSIPMSSGGHGYTAPTAVWNNDGGGSGHTVGTPALATGVTSYTVVSGGSGLTNGGFYWNPTAGSQTGFRAIGWVTVSGGAVTSIVPLSGSPISYGGGYSTSFSDAYGNSTITCNVSNYISGIPVTAPGTGFTSRPTYTITDSTGSGAVAAPQMALSASDVVTYSVANNWLSTTLGSSGPATNEVIPNFVGVLEGPTGHVSGFRDTPTTLFGGEYTGQSNQSSFECWAKNKMLTSLPFGGSSVILDSNYFPVSWTPGGTITCQFGGSSEGVQAFPYGIYTVVYDDPGTDTTSVTLNTPDFTFLTQTQVGTTITQTWRWNANVFAAGRLNITSSSGTMKISMPWIFAPGNTIDRSNKFAVDDALVANFTNSAGTGPAHFRFMTQVGGTGFNSMVDVSDLTQLDNMFAGNNIPYNAPPPVNLTTIVAARFLNTNPTKSSTGDNTYPWPASTKLYSNAPWAVSGTDSFGHYLDMTAGPFGASDNGNIFSLGGSVQGDHGVVEFRTSSPHGLKTGQIVALFTQTSKTLPFASGGNVPIPNGATVNPFVTGASTFCVLIGTNGTSALVDKINSTAEIALSSSPLDVYLSGTTIPNTPNWTPYELQAEIVKRFPGSNLWLTVTPTMSHALVTEIANRVAARLGPTNGIIFELGDEHWNTAFPYIQNVLYLRQLTNFVQYAPAGQPFLTYGVGGQTWFLNSGVADIANSVLSADYFNVFKTAWVAAGRSPSQLVPTYGAWWTNASVAQSVAAAVVNFGLPQTNAIVTGAPYVTPTLAQPSKIAAYTDAGNVAVASPQNWPCDAINDFERHAMFYNPNFWGEWAIESAQLAGTSLRMGTYEGGVTQILDINQGGPTLTGLGSTVTQSSLVQEDCMNSPSWADFVYAWGLLVQRGYPLVAHSGAPRASWLNLWGGGQIGGVNDWYIAQSPVMPHGLSAPNSFMTPQGGFLGSSVGTGIFGYSQANQAPGFQGLLKFNAAASTPAPVQPATAAPAAVLLAL